jgi:hypothetical protein
VFVKRLSDWLLVTHKTQDGYVKELVRSDDLRVVVAGGSFSNLTGRDCDVVEICRPGEPGGVWAEVHADKVEEVLGFDASALLPVDFKAREKATMPVDEVIETLERMGIKTNI